MFVYSRMHAHTRMHTHIQAHTHTHTHTHALLQLLRIRFDVHAENLWFTPRTKAKRHVPNHSQTVNSMENNYQCAANG